MLLQREGGIKEIRKKSGVIRVNGRRYNTRRKFETVFAGNEYQPRPFL
jgi:hypothetical protein